MLKVRISGLDIVGDSLSDRGALAARLFGATAAGISKTSPRGRFTNGLTWSDYLANALIGRQAELAAHNHELPHPHNLPAADISDGYLSHPSTMQADPQATYQRNADLADDVLLGRAGVSQYNLDDNAGVSLDAQTFVRTYAEGGLTAKDWSDELTTLPAEGARLAVSNLGAKTALQLENDSALNLTDEELGSRLQVIWAGANDLITVNNKPTVGAAEAAVKAVKADIIKRYEAGYRNFRLLNLPDLSKTPRYRQGGIKGDQEAAAIEATRAYNEALKAAVADLAQQFSNKINVGILDVSAKYDEIYANPAAYGLDPDKLNTPFVESDDFERVALDDGEDISPAKGYTSWDGVHPTADVHAILGDWILGELNKDFTHLDSLSYQQQWQPDIITQISQKLDGPASDGHHSKVYDALENINPDTSPLFTVKLFTTNFDAALVEKFKNEYRTVHEQEKRHFLSYFFRQYRAPLACSDLNSFIEHARKQGPKSRSAKILIEMKVLVLDGKTLKLNPIYRSLRQSKAINLKDVIATLPQPTAANASMLDPVIHSLADTIKQVQAPAQSDNAEVAP